MTIESSFIELEKMYTECPEEKLLIEKMRIAYCDMAKIAEYFNRSSLVKSEMLTAFTKTCRKLAMLSNNPGDALVLMNELKDLFEKQSIELNSLDGAYGGININKSVNDLQEAIDSILGFEGLPVGCGEDVKQD